MVNLISVSGGKDSTALALLAMGQNTPNLQFVFSDTGNEARITYDYIDYLDDIIKSRTGQNIIRLKADFTEKINKKREKLIANGEVERAKATVSTGNPFLDLAIWKGRFPSTMARFCTVQLKIFTTKNYITNLLERGEVVMNWSGIRAEESPKRAKMPERELFFEIGNTKCWHYRPLLDWTTDQVFEYIESQGVKPNPLYSMGFTRVGCFPCIMARKGEIRLIAENFPKEIERIREWEQLAGKASARGQSTFFKIEKGRECLDDWVAWSKTKWGGKIDG